MTELEQLVNDIAPPPNPVVGDLDRAHNVIDEYPPVFPEEFWQIAEAYGIGAFYDRQMTLLHPCEPIFVESFLARTMELRDVVEDYGSQHGLDWIPIFNVNEWALFSPAHSDATGGYLFACLGDEDFHLAEPGLARFIREYPALETMLFSDLSEALPREFKPHSNFYLSSPKSVRLAAEAGGMPFAFEMFERLRECWPDSAKSQ